MSSIATHYEKYINPFIDGATIGSISGLLIGLACRVLGLAHPILGMLASGALIGGIYSGGIAAPIWQDAIQDKIVKVLIGVALTTFALYIGGVALSILAGSIATVRYLSAGVIYATQDGKFHSSLEEVKDNRWITASGIVAGAVVIVITSLVQPVAIPLTIAKVAGIVCAIDLIGNQREIKDLVTPLGFPFPEISGSK